MFIFDTGRLETNNDQADRASTDGDSDDDDDMPLSKFARRTDNDEAVEKEGREHTMATISNILHRASSEDKVSRILTISEGLEKSISNFSNVTSQNQRDILQLRTDIRLVMTDVKHVLAEQTRNRNLMKLILELLQGTTETSAPTSAPPVPTAPQTTPTVARTIQNASSSSRPTPLPRPTPDELETNEHRRQPSQPSHDQPLRPVSRNDNTYTPKFIIAPNPDELLLGGEARMPRSREWYEKILKHVKSRDKKQNDQSRGSILCTALLRAEFSEDDLASHNVTGTSRNDDKKIVPIPKLDETKLRAIFGQAKCQFPGFRDWYTQARCITVDRLNNVCRKARRERVRQGRPIQATSASSAVEDNPDNLMEPPPPGVDLDCIDPARDPRSFIQL